MRILVLGLLIGLAFAAPPPLVAQDPGGAAVETQGPADALRPGDVIRVRIWREPDLSGEFPIDEHGTVVLPKVGPVPVLQKSADAVKELLAAEYQRFLNHSSVEITLLRRVQVLGAVRNPGLYPIDPTVAIGDVIALAGGILPQGHPDKVELIRDGRKLPGSLSGRTRIADSPIRSGDQLYVPERSWVARNTGTVIGVSMSVISILVSRLW